MFPHFPVLCRSPWAKALAARHGGARCAVKPSPSTTLSNYGEILSHPSNQTIMEPVMTARTQFPRLRLRRAAPGPARESLSFSCQIIFKSLLEIIFAKPPVLSMKYEM